MSNSFVTPQPVACSVPGSSVHGISQARILEWGAISFSRASSWTRNRTCVSCISRQFLYHWATREGQSNMTDTLTRKGQRYTKKTAMWPQAEIGVMHLTSQATPRITGNHQKLKETWKKFAPTSFRGGMTLSPHWFQTSATAAAKSLQSYPTLCDPIDGSPPGSPSLGFSRQEHWSGLPFPSPMHESEKWKWSRSVVSDS